MGTGRSKADRGLFGGIGGSGLTQIADLDHSPALQKALDKEEKRTRDFKREQMTVLDENGNVLLHRQGGNGHVTYKISEARDYFDGATITHNHPHGDERGGVSATFSTADVETFRYGLKEMRASGAEGTYVLRNKNWNNKDTKAYEFWQAYETFTSNQNFSGIKNIKAAQEKAHKSKIGKQYDSEIKKAGELWNKGLKDEATKLFSNAEKNLKPQYKKEIQKILYEDMNAKTSGWLKQNANKYGFEYRLTR